MITNLKKRGQFQMSFGILFSIILIISFLIFGFYVITKFLDMQETIKIGSFKTSLENEIERASHSYSQDIVSKKYTYALPLKIEYVCIIDFEKSAKGYDSEKYDEIRQMQEDTIYFYPREKLSLISVEIKHIDIQKTTEEHNPFCIQNKQGRLELRLKKVEGNPKVIIIK